MVTMHLLFGPFRLSLLVLLLKIQGTTAFAKSTYREATFGMGCFWKPSEELLKVPGVVDTVCGYTGVEATEKPPTYDQVCFSRDWVEGVRVIYDESQLSYEELLDAFFQAQEPKFGSRQYASIIFPHDEAQQKVASTWLASNSDSLVRKDGVTPQWTSVERLKSFYQAEGYHQRYWQKFRPRVALIVALIAISSGALDQFTPNQYTAQVHSIANNISLAGLLFTLAERKIDNKVIEL